MHRKIKTKHEHLQDLKNKHGSRYQYPIHKWKDNLRSTDVVEIICKQHGPFYMKLSDHKRGYNCPVCSRIEGYKKRRETSIKHFKARLPSNITLDCYDWETKEALLTCSKHGPIIKKIRQFSKASESENLCRHCLMEARGYKKQFLKEYGVSDIIISVKTYLSLYDVKQFMADISKATHLGSYTFTHRVTKEKIELTLNDIKNICDAETLF